MRFLLLLLGLVTAGTLGATEQQPRVCRPVNEQRPQSFDDAINRPSPTYFRLMGFRYARLQQTMAGFEKTSRAMVSLDDDGVLTPAECGDDPGLYATVPIVARNLGLPLNRAIDLTLGAVTGVPLLYGFLLCWRNEKWRSRQMWMFGAWAVVLLLGMLVGDVYAIASAIAAAGIAVGTSVDWSSRSGLLHVLVIGAIASVANLFRSHSGTVALLFVIAIMLVASLRMQRVAVLVAALTVGTLIPLSLMQVVISKRNVELSRMQQAAQVIAGHPFWHSIYVGLGFVNNDSVREMKDEAAVQLVRAKDPMVAYYSPAYEGIMRSAVFSVARHNPKVIAANVLAKAGTILLIVAVVMWPVMSWLRRPLFSRESVPFLLAGAFSSIPGIIAYPAPRYLAGLFGLLAMFIACQACSSREETKVRGAAA
jgi:hypothetical protein